MKSRSLGLVIFLVTGSFASVLFSQDDSPAQSRTGEQKTPEFSQPSRIQIDGTPLSIKSGYASPTFADIDSDGTDDLIVGTYVATDSESESHVGGMKFYKNIGQQNSKFAAAELLKAGEQTLNVPGVGP